MLKHFVKGSVISLQGPNVTVHIKPQASGNSVKSNHRSQLHMCWHVAEGNRDGT